MTLICTEIQQDKPTDGSRIFETDVIAQVRIITSIATISFSLKKKKKVQENLSMYIYRYINFQNMPQW